MEYEYRIIELDNKFIIEVGCERRCGFLWQKKKMFWYKCNVLGSPKHYCRDSWDERKITKKLPAFKTLKSAQEQVDRFTPKYHNNIDAASRVIFNDIELNIISKDILKALDDQSLDMSDRIIRQDILRNIQDNS